MNTLEKKVLELANPVALNLGYAVVDIKIFGKEKITLQIFLEKEDYTSVSIGDCVNFSREFSIILDVNNLIEQRYSLEVSSAGIDRKLAKIEDFKRFIGNNVIVKTKLPISGQKTFKGLLSRVENSSIEVVTNENNNISIHIDFIEKANLDLLKNLLKNSDLNKKNRNIKHKKSKQEEKNAK